jgi:hypothetical protein
LVAAATSVAQNCGRYRGRFRCRRCRHESLIDLTEAVWPREKPVHTLAKVLRCQACKDERKKAQPDLVALRPRDPPQSEPPAAKRRAGGRS